VGSSSIDNLQRVEAVFDRSHNSNPTFIRQLGAVGDPIGRQFLPSIGWRTGLSGAPPDMNSTCPVPNLLPFLAQSTVGPLVPLAHRTLSGAHQTVRCAQPTVGAGHGSLADCTAEHWLQESFAHRTVRCTPDSPVNFSRGLLTFSRER
jgi:hypothetical protein